MKKLINEFNDIIYKCDILDKKNVFKTFIYMTKIVEDKKFNIEVNNINNHIKKMIKLNDKNKNCENKNCNECILINENKIFINFIEYKNKLLIKELDKLETYNNTINLLLNNYNNKFNKKTNDKNIKLAIEKLLLENINEFNGNWDIIKCNSNGIPKKIEILNPLKIDKLYCYINEYN
jgi:hypothetical protein